MTTYSVQKVAFAASSAAALAAVAATAYYVYRMRRRGTQNKSQPNSTTLQSERKSLKSPVQPSSPQPSHPVHAEIHVPEDKQPQHAEESVQSSSHSSTEKTITANNNSFAWAVFWDIENVPVPRTTSATQFVQALRKTLAAHRNQTNPDSILRIHAIANIRRTSMQLRNHLQANGVNVTHVESKGRKDAADKALITEICLITHEHPTPFGICLISGDGDFSYPVSRLTALGYATVVIAPTRHSFSTLLEAVPEAVIPLRSVLECHEDKPIEPQPPRRDESLMRRPNNQPTNQKVMRHPLPIVPLITPLHMSRGADKRVARKKRRERILPPTSMSERDDNDHRPWSSDDDRSETRVTHLRISRRPPQPYALTPSTEFDAQIPASQANRPYVASIRDSPVSPPRLMPLPSEQVRNQGGPRPRGSRPGLDNGRQNIPQPITGAESRLLNGSVSRKISMRKMDMETARVPHSKPDDRKGMANGPRVRFARDTVIPGNGERTRPRDDVPQENSGRNVTESSGRRKIREPKKQTSPRSNQTSSADGSDSLKVPLRIESRWFYCGTRALPFMVILIVLGLSLLFTSLRVSIAVLEVLRRV